MTPKKYTGKLISIDMYNCDANIISDAKTSETVLNTGCEKFAMNLKQIVCCQENEAEEFSLSAVCKQGHVTLHIYPQIGFVTADVFSCCEGSDPAGMARYLRLSFDADKSKITLLNRGDFGSESDMKPKKRSSIKFIRRTENLGGKIKKMIFKPRSI
ncbi:MAG: S-adenosylmethionine decarboxylase [Acidaminococcaceae bacterium]|nr:S-adenosylmethionine decarboxylase [Acidaminococcaceae bacterium]